VLPFEVVVTNKKTPCGMQEVSAAANRQPAR
jgi:hypothetical protein